MNILDAILNAQGGGVVKQLAGQFNLGEDQAQSAIGALLPALAGAVRQNTASEDGLSGLLGALAGGGHQQYLDDPATLANPETVADGNGILGHLLGSKEVSREVASRAAAQTGLDTGILKQMLPLVASLMMGGLSKGQASAAPAGGLLEGLGAAMGMGASQPQAGGGILDMLTPLVDQDRDGSALDDILGMAAKFLRR